MFLLRKPLSLWYSVKAALAKAYTASLCFLLPNKRSKEDYADCNHSRVRHANEDLGIEPTANKGSTGRH